MVGQILPCTHHARREVLVPPTEGSHDEVVESANNTRYQQWLSLVAALGTTDQHLRRSRGLGEGILAVHVADKILAERNEKQNADDAAEERRDEYLHERGTHLGILRLEYIDGRQGEDGTSNHGTRTGTDALDDDILAQRLRPLRGRRDTHRNDGYRDGCLEHLTHLQSQIGGSGREHHRHDDAPRHRPGIHFWILLPRIHQRLIFFSFLQFPKRILGKLNLLQFIIHNSQFIILSVICVALP